MVWLKFVHIAAIAIWSAGLIRLPGLYVRRTHVPDAPSLHRLQALVRFLYVAAMSPAAFVAIATGIGLVFLRETWAPWFGIKLVFVGILAAIHILTGLIIIRLFDEGQIYPVWRFVAATTFTLATVATIVFLAVAKPDIPSLLPQWMHEPGALRRLLGGFTAFRRS